MMLGLLVIGLLLLALALRLVPYFLAPDGAGIDHWFWKAYIETYQRTREFPPVLPQYTLDQHQWYPPIFPLLLARLPARWFAALSPAIAIVIDLLRMLLLLAMAGWQSDGNLRVIAIAGLIYATVPIQTSYNMQLNPRGLGALMLEIILMLLLWYYLNGAAWVWLPIVILAGLLLLTHKMTSQLFWFIVIGMAVIYRRPLLLTLVPASMAAALVLSRGFYWKVLRAHWDIIVFWNAQWRWAGADLLRESPLYGDGSYERPQKLHRVGLQGVLWHAYILFGFNPAVWIACLLLYERVFVHSPLLIYPTYLLVWLLLMCAFSLLTTFVPRLKCLGAGYLYVYNTSLLAALLLSLTFEYTRAPWLSTPLVLLALFLNCAGLLRYYMRFRQDRRGRVDPGLNAMLELLRPQPRGVVMCVPANWYDLVAYRTGQPVMWGGHGYGFKLLSPVWPRLMLPIRTVLSRYRIRYLLTMDGMLPEKFVDELPPARVLTHREYQLYCFDEAVQSEGPGAVGSRPTPA